MFLKQAIDALGGGNPAQHAIQAAVAALLVSGACRIVSSLAKEAQGPLFTPVSQVWCVACDMRCWPARSCPDSTGS